MIEAAPTSSASPYKIYWRAWSVLLAITLIMVFLSSPFLLITGMCIKASIIAFWFMHLKEERTDFVLYILFGIFATALILYFLIAPDGRAM